jgi:hypothetical protein
MRKYWWLFGLAVVIWIVFGVLVVAVYERGLYGVPDENYFYNSGEAVSDGYFSLSDSKMTFRAIVRLNSVYESRDKILADIEWGPANSNTQTVEIGNSNRGLNFVFLTKQSSTDFFPISEDMETTQVYYDDLISELKPFVGRNVVMDFFNTQPTLRDDVAEDIAEYAKALRLYMNCNSDFVKAFSEGQSGIQCNPVSHQIYVVKN